MVHEGGIQIPSAELVRCQETREMVELDRHGLIEDRFGHLGTPRLETTEVIAK